MGSNSRALIALFVLAMITACVAFSVEMSRLKSKIVGLQQLMAVLDTSLEVNMPPFFGLLCCSPSLIPLWSLLGQDPHWLCRTRVL